jgi:two-component system chemotaxis response regulator CheB
MAEPLKVLIVDDSRIFRAALQRALEGIADVKVVGSVWNGAKALEFLQSQPVDLATLDVEMPTMDGLATLREMQKLAAAGALKSSVGCLLISAHTERGAQVTVEGLEAGAFDFITKPAADDPEQAVAILRDELAAKIQWFRSRRKNAGSVAASRIPAAEPRVEPAARRSIRAICIAVSTGGPQALATLLPSLTAQCNVPILIVQHMPVGFTHYLAESLSKRCGRPVREGRDGEPVAMGGVYLAPGGRHMLVRARGDREATILLNEQPLVNGCRPSGDVLLRSAASVFGAHAIGLVMTGMGQDGAQGLLAMKRVGAATIAQDEPTSVVWGMPGAAVSLGAAERVVPLEQIAGFVAALVARGGDFERPRS